MSIHSSQSASSIQHHPAFALCYYYYYYYYYYHSSMMKEEGYALYVDHAQHPAPLSNTFHATGARRLSSDVFRYPPATLTEVVSAYCPQCLSYHDSASAARLGECGLLALEFTNG